METEMKVLVYRYGSICEPDVIEAFQKLKLDVVEETTEMNQKNLLPSQQVKLVKDALEQYHPMFVFSINFFPAIADICHIYRIKYLCWTVDCPVAELFSASVQYETNRIFLFDRMQYEAVYPLNPKGIFYLPLAAATERFDAVVDEITSSDKKKYEQDISFVGSLYIEKNPLQDIRAKLSDFAAGYIDGIVEASLQVMGYNFLEETVTEEIIEELKAADSHFYHAEDSLVETDRFIAAHSYLGIQAAEEERIRTLNTLAKYFSVHLYTRSDVSKLQGVQVHGGVKTLTEMPKIFSLSKINLNMTIKPIQSGLPLRIFDIMGCGGFCMTNFQAELPEFFQIGTEIEAYGSLDELVDKCSYYLTHEEERKQIARNGYEKVKKSHKYIDRMIEMINKSAKE